MKTSFNSFHPETKITLVISRSAEREYMDVYNQKAVSSAEFVCISHEESAIGQHLLDFLSVSIAKLPPLVAEFKRQFSFIQTMNFDHHLVLPYLETVLQLYLRITEIHPWWRSALSAHELIRDFQQYSFVSIHPSPYLIETYDEVDRLVNEENTLGLICDNLKDDLRWLEFYASALPRLGDALLGCLDASPPEELSGLSALQRAYIFQSFFDEHFLRNTNCSCTIVLGEAYSSPLGRTVHRDALIYNQKLDTNSLFSDNMDFDSIVIKRNSPIAFEHLVDTVRNKPVELTTTLFAGSPSDIYATCSQLFSMLVQANAKIRKCKNCGKYFVPINRSDESYCCRVQENGKTCRELDYAEKITSDNILSIYRTAYKTHNARKQRNLQNRVSADKEFREWVDRAKQLLERAKQGEISPEDFRSLIRD